ncbi:hypothetical protein, partial [Pseudacidovorax intermedius]|uniref:hypothetical protein n=1 Tax=Pseudacidovorax intermedius TaxID=433924 RepID=UPI001E52DC42
MGNSPRPQRALPLKKQGPSSPEEFGNKFDAPVILEYFYLDPIHRFFLKAHQTLPNRNALFMERREFPPYHFPT